MRPSPPSTTSCTGNSVVPAASVGSGLSVSTPSTCMPRATSSRARLDAECRMPQRPLGAEVRRPARVDHDDRRHALGQLAELVDADRRAVAEPVDVQHERLADELVERDARPSCGRRRPCARARRRACRCATRAASAVTAAPSRSSSSAGVEVHRGVARVHLHAAADRVAEVTHAAARLRLRHPRGARLAHAPACVDRSRSDEQQVEHERERERGDRRADGRRPDVRPQVGARPRRPAHDRDRRPVHARRGTSSGRRAALRMSGVYAPRLTM